MKDVFVVTGATGGIGSDIAKNITKKGIVLITDLNEESLISLKKSIAKDNVKCEYLVCDVSDLKNVKELAKKTKELGNFKAMVHCAGVSGHMGNSEKILQINLVGTKYLMDEFLKLADNSVFINVASMSGHMVPDNRLYDKLLLNPTTKDFIKKIKIFASNSDAAYAFSKKGVIMLTEKEVEKWAAKDSRVISVSPGVIVTKLALLEAEANPSVDIIVKKSPAGRYGKPKEITTLVNFLLSKDAEFITGVDFLIDGGATSLMKYNDILGQKKPFPKSKFIIGLIYLLSFIGLPIISTITDVPNNFYFIIFIINMLTMLVSSFYLIDDDKMDYPFVLLPLILYLISGIISTYTISLLTGSFILLFAYMIQIIQLVYRNSKKKQLKNS